MMRLFTVALLFSFGMAHAGEPSPENIKLAITTIQSVKPEGEGNADAASAWKVLVDVGPSAIMPILESISSQQPDADAMLSAAWFDSALSAIVEQNKELPIASVREFLTDTTNDRLARFFAYELLKQADPDSIKAMQLKMIDDPNPIIRSEAIARRLEQLPEEKVARTAELKQLFEAARDFEQTQSLAKQLKELGIPANVPKHLGVVTQWQADRPIRQHRWQGIQSAIPAGTERSILLRPPAGKNQTPLTWKSFQSDGDNGTIDLNKALGKNMDAAGYAYATLLSTKEQPARFAWRARTRSKYFSMVRRCSSVRSIIMALASINTLLP